MNKISPFLWFDGIAKEAAEYYVSIFKNSKIIDSNHMFTTFVIDGLQVMALNGGPQYTFTEAISFFVSCADQVETDEYWNKLVADGGKAGQCGWLKDKFGLSWQIIPQQLGQLLSDKDPIKAGKVMTAMRSMSKIVVADLEAAKNS